MSRILLIFIVLIFCQCSSQRTPSNNYLFRGVNNPKARKPERKISKNKTLYQGITASTRPTAVKINHKSLFKGLDKKNEKKTKSGLFKSLYKSAADPNINHYKPKKVNDIQYNGAYKYDLKGKKNRKFFKQKKGS